MRSRPSGGRELSVQSAGLDSPSTLGQGHRPGRAPTGRWGRLARGALVFVTVLSLAAAAISGYARYLERRLTSCGRRRELVPNLVAVDFYERSGVVDVVRRRNAAG